MVRRVVLPDAARASSPSLPFIFLCCSFNDNDVKKQTNINFFILHINKLKNKETLASFSQIKITG